MITRRDPRRFSERLDGRMISEDRNAVANLPREFINREWRPDHFNPMSEVRETFALIKNFMGII